MKRLSTSLAPLVLVTALALTGCSTKKETQDGPLPAVSQDTRVEVTNNNWLDMAVYAERGGLKVRLGMVTSMGNETLTIPRNVMASSSGIRLIASPIGSSSAYATYPMDVWPGETVEFTIENNLGTSNVAW